MIPIPYRDESNNGTHKRTYWPRGDAMGKRLEIGKKTLNELASKGKKYTKEDRAKVVNEKWGEYCETQRSLDERSG